MYAEAPPLPLTGDTQAAILTAVYRCKSMLHVQHSLHYRQIPAYKQIEGRHDCIVAHNCTCRVSSKHFTARSKANSNTAQLILQAMLLHAMKNTCVHFNCQQGLLSMNLPTTTLVDTCLQSKNVPLQIWTKRLQSDSEYICPTGRITVQSVTCKIMHSTATSKLATKQRTAQLPVETAV